MPPEALQREQDRRGSPFRPTCTRPALPQQQSTAEPLRSSNLYSHGHPYHHQYQSHRAREDDAPLRGYYKHSQPMQPSQHWHGCSHANVDCSTPRPHPFSADNTGSMGYSYTPSARVRLLSSSSHTRCHTRLAPREGRGAAWVLFDTRPRRPTPTLPDQGAYLLQLLEEGIPVRLQTIVKPSAHEANRDRA
ncbi:unnamed protein product [Cutaneotrichosporon oleaginosum]